MTFKEKLIEQAETYENDISIQEDMEFIKSEMTKCSYKRAFKINLLKPHSIIAVGCGTLGQISLIIPSGIRPAVYRQKFIDALFELGFTNENISTTEKYYKGSHDDYTIHITW